MLNSTPELTVFLPVDSAWDVLPKIERMYLESEFSEDDILQILGMHAVVTEGVHWSDSFQPARNCQFSSTCGSQFSSDVIYSNDHFWLHVGDRRLPRIGQDFSILC